LLKGFANALTVRDGHKIDTELLDDAIAGNVIY
jgi:hypothetical protein